MSVKDNSSSSIKRHDSEKGDEAQDFVTVVTADSKFKFDVVDTDGVQRRLKQRHVQMYVFSYIYLTHLLFSLARIAVSSSWC